MAALKKGHSLGQDNGDCVVEDTLSKNQHVEHRVHVKRIENGNSGHRVDGRNQGAKRKAAQRRKGRGHSATLTLGPTQ